MLDNEKVELLKDKMSTWVDDNFSTDNPAGELSKAIALISTRASIQALVEYEKLKETK
jgi:hypothetical protein